VAATLVVALPERFGKYHVLERIARGGMAEIYKVKTVGIAGFEKIQALKRILPDYAQRPRFIRSFVDEARIAVELNHRNIVQVFDFGKASGELYLAMELIDGIDLRSAIVAAAAKNKALPIALACYVLGDVATGLDHAHRKRDVQGEALGIVHCDVSPQNIMLSYEGFVKILDFGVARARISTTPRERRLRGKPRYMSPEQTRGTIPTTATDVFSLGIIAWELLTGLPLFEGRNLKAILAAVRRADVPAIHKLNPDVPEDLSDAISKALSRDVDQRNSATELAQALARGAHTIATGAGARALAEWLHEVCPPGGPEPRDETGVTNVEVPAAPMNPGPTVDTVTIARSAIEDIDESDVQSQTSGLLENRRVVVVVVVADGGTDTSRHQLVRMLADLAYKRGAVLREEDDTSLVAVFGLEVAGEDNVAKAMSYAMDAGAVAREASTVSEGIAVRIGARAGVVAQHRAPSGYRLVGDAVSEARGLAREAQPDRPLLSGGVGRHTPTYFSFREKPARRGARRRMRVLELLGTRSFDERDQAFRARRGRFVGRQEELGHLGGMFRKAIVENRRVTVLVSGRAGVGKSRLVAEFIARAEAAATNKPLLIPVSATPAGQATPFSLIINLVLSSLNLAPGRGETARARMGQRLRHVLNEAGLVSDHVDEIVATFELATELRDGALISQIHTSADMRTRVAGTMTMFRQVLRPAHRALLTVFEDLHFADVASAETVRLMLRPPPAQGAELLLLTTRSDEDTAPSWLWEDASDLDLVIDLEELGAEDRVALIEDRLADAANEQAVQAVSRRAGGNPLFIEELSSAVREVGAAKIPSTARDVILYRVDRLMPEVKVVLQHAAVLGRRCSARLLEELLDSDLDDAIDELCAEVLLRAAEQVPWDDQLGDLEFAHGVIQEVVYDALSARARRETHAKVGELLMSRYQAGREEPPATIAHHLELGNKKGAAAAYWLRAGRVALAAFDANGAVNAFSKTLTLERELGAKPKSTASAARRREAHLGREKAYGQLGEHDKQARDLERLERLADGNPRRLADVNNRAATRHLRLGDYAAAVAATEKAESAAEKAGDERSRGQALRSRGEAFERQGEYDNAIEVVRRALAIFRRIGAANEETSAMIGIARIHLVRAKYEEAREAYVPILERLEDAGDPWLERIANNHVAVIHLCLGEFEDAMAAAERSVEICRHFGDTAREGDNLSVCGIILSEVGRYEEARDYFTRSLAIHDRTGSRWSRADCLVYAGATEAYLGNYDTALTHLREALGLAKEIGAKYIEANCLVAEAAALLRRSRDDADIDRALEAATKATTISRNAKLVGPEIQGLSRQAQAIWKAGYLDAALALSTRAVRLLHKHRHLEGTEEEIYFTHYQLLNAAGDPNAKVILARAYQGFIEKLDRMQKPEWIHSFSQEVSLHASLQQAFNIKS